MDAIKDHFSGHSDEYAAYRPEYPEAFVDFLADLAPRRETAWEAGCGSGQLTAALARRFDRVIATDVSEYQISEAPRLSNVDFRRARAEDSGLESHVADLCVAAQAAHWFDLEAYYAEVRRVGNPGGAVVLATYGLASVDERVDAIVARFYARDLAPYWPPERKLVEDAYASLPFPFEEIAVPGFEMRAKWTLPRFVGYVRTWSGLRNLQAAEGPRAADAFFGALEEAWGDPGRARTVTWPLSLRAGRLSTDSASSR